MWQRFARLLWWRPPCILRSVIINLVSDHEVAIRGVLWRYRGAWLVLRDASLLSKAGTAPVPIIGETILHRTNVAFLQVLP